MKKIIAKEIYPVYQLEIEKSNFNKSIWDILNHYLKKIEEDSVAELIWVFDHYTHTKKINWPIVDGVVDAKIVVFCFGSKISSIISLTFKPKSFSIIETEDKFIIEFMEPPSEIAVKKMTNWTKELLA